MKIDSALQKYVEKDKGTMFCVKVENNQIEFCGDNNTLTKIDFNDLSQVTVVQDICSILFTVSTSYFTKYQIFSQLQCTK